MLNSESDDAIDATIVLTKTILQVLVLHYRDGEKDGKITQALDALASAAGITIAGGTRDAHRARVYFVQRLTASIEQAEEDARR